MGNLAKQAHDSIPFCQDQGIPTFLGASQTGLSFQTILTTMPVGGVITFATFGLADMADGDYALFIQNHTDPADEALVARVDRLTTGFTITNTDAADVLDILVVGKLKGQVGDGPA